MKTVTSEVGAMAGIQVLGGLMQVLMNKGILNDADMQAIVDDAKRSSAGKADAAEINDLIDTWIKKA